MAETGGRAHRCGDCAGCRRRNDGGCGRCLMCLKKRHGSDAQGRQSCANHWCSQMRAYDNKGPVQGLAGWSVIAIPRVADGEDYYYLSPEGGRLRSRHEVLIYLKMGPTPAAPAGWNWDAPPLPARPTPAAPRGSAAHKAALVARAPTAPQLEAAKGLYETWAARAAESGSPPAPAPTPAPRAPAPSAPAPSAPAPRAPPPRSAPAPAIMPAPAPASRDARARARRDDREFDGLNEAIRRSMEEVGAPAPAPPAPRDRSIVGQSLGRDEGGRFRCPAGCPRTFAHAPAAVQHGRSCAAGGPRDADAEDDDDDDEAEAPIAPPAAPRDEGTLEPRVDGDWEAAARKLLREVKDAVARQGNRGAGGASLEQLRPMLTSYGFSNTKDSWRSSYVELSVPAHFPSAGEGYKNKIRSIPKLERYLTHALGEASEDEEEEDDDDDEDDDDEAETPTAPPAATPAAPTGTARRALVLPRAMDLATLSEGHLREEAKRRKLGPLPSDGKPELLALLRGEVSPGADFLPRLVRTDWRPGEWCLGVWDHDWNRTAEGIPKTWYGLVVKANADGTLVVAFTDDDDQHDVRPGELRALDRSLTGCSKGVRWARARLEEHGTATADALGRLVEPPRRGGVPAATGRRSPAPRPAARQPRRAPAPAAAPALTTREPDANGLRFYDANAVRTPNNRALEERKIDELWDTWHRQLKITNQGVVHGHGTVAKVRLIEGRTIVDPTAIYMEGPPPDRDQDGGARSERFLYINQRNHLKIGSYAGEPRGAWALSYFVNEARNQEPNAKRTIERALPGTCSALTMLRDVYPGEEICVRYVDESYEQERERLRLERGTQRYRYVYPPKTAGASWNTCVGIEGKSTSAGTYPTEEAAARAIDALLLANDMAAVNFPGEEAATQAAFPQFFAQDEPASSGGDDDAAEPDAADEPAPAGSDTDDGPPPAPEDESDSDESAAAADPATQLHAELVAFLPANADFLANIAPFAAARASSLAELAALPADALHEVLDAAGWKMLKANAFRRALARYRNEHAAPATDDADEDAGDDGDDAPPPAPAAAAPAPPPAPAATAPAPAPEPAAPPPPTAPAAAAAPSPEPAAAAPLPAPVAAPAAPEPVAAPSREELSDIDDGTFSHVPSSAAALERAEIEAQAARQVAAAEAQAKAEAARAEAEAKARAEAEARAKAEAESNAALRAKIAELEKVAAAAKMKGKKWEREEDEALRRAVGESREGSGPINWQSVFEKMKSMRAESTIRDRWTKLRQRDNAADAVTLDMMRDKAAAARADQPPPPPLPDEDPARPPTDPVVPQRAACRVAGCRAADPCRACRDEHLDGQPPLPPPVEGPATPSVAPPPGATAADAPARDPEASSDNVPDRMRAAADGFRHEPRRDDTDDDEDIACLASAPAPPPTMGDLKRIFGATAAPARDDAPPPEADAPAAPPVADAPPPKRRKKQQTVGPGSPTERPAAVAPADDSDADDECPWPRDGDTVEVVWTKGTTLENPGSPRSGGIDRCVVELIRDPVPHKKRKASVPEDRAYHCYAQLQSLIKLAGDQKDEYEVVPESDPRPKHVHLKYKLDLAEKGRTWRIITPKRPRADDSLEPAAKRPRDDGGM